MNIYQKYVISLIIGCIGFLFYQKYMPAGRSRSNYSTLRVAVNAEMTFYTDSVKISKPFFSEWGRYGIEYDTILNRRLFVFDSVRNGSVDVTVVSHLDTTFTRKIQLSGDTIIVFSKEELPGFEKKEKNDLDLANLQPGEEICLAIESNGCFHHYTEKTIIQRAKDGFKIRFWSHSGYRPDYQELYFDNSFADSLANFQSRFLDFFHTEEMPGGCTTSTTFFFQKGNKAWLFHDRDCSDGPGYYAFINTLGIGSSNTDISPRILPPHMDSQ